MSDKPCFFNGGHLICPGGWERKRHSHSFFQLILIYSGKMIVEINKQRIEASQKDIVFYKRDIAHKEWNCSPIPLEMIYLDWEGPEPDLPVLTKDFRGRARIMAEWLLHDFKTSLSPGTDDSVDSMMNSIILETKRNAYPKEDDFIHMVQTAIIENLCSSITLNSLAEMFGMNKFTFLRKYKKKTGRTPMDDLRRIRIEQARDLIISSDLPLKDIAEKSGLSNEQHLSRVFSRQLKVPPGYFRRNH